MNTKTIKHRCNGRYAWWYKGVWVLCTRYGDFTYTQFRDEAIKYVVHGAY